MTPELLLRGPAAPRRVRIGDIAKPRSERNRDRAVEDVRSVTNSGGLVRTSEYFENARTSQDTSQYRVVHSGDFVYNPARINVGSIDFLANAGPVIVSPMYVVFSVDQTSILPEFLKFWFETTVGRRRVGERVEQGARNRLTFETLSQLELDIPSLEVQRRIVAQLGVLRALRANLAREREARLSQYVYFRDLLLTFPKDGNVRWARLNELGSFMRGKRFTKADYSVAGVPCIHYGEIYTHYGTWARDVVSHLRPAIRDGLRYAEPGDVVIVDVGETVEDVGKAVAWLGAEPVAIHDHSYAFRHSLSPMYVSYVMQTSWFIRERAKHIARTKVKTLLIDSFSSIEIPVPPREEQDRLVAILDKLDTFVNDLSIGLPAEIAARRKQYEHYRDKLLTFAEAAHE